jgi:Holliday junction resolvase RusA-like endonuclease
MTFFFIPGIPVPQGSKRGFVRGGKVRLVEAAGEKHTIWRNQVTIVADQHRPPFPIDDPVKLTLCFAMPKPSSAARKIVWAKRRPDLDKLIRCVVDGLADAGFFTDDSRVVAIEASKQYADRTGVMVDLEVLD